LVEGAAEEVVKGEVVAANLLEAELAAEALAEVLVLAAAQVA
jgi:hypothetical protein